MNKPYNVVYTRYYLDDLECKSILRKKGITTDQWIAARSTIFQKVTLPSITSMKLLPDEMVIFTSSDTYQLVENSIKAIDWIRIVTCETSFDFWHNTAKKDAAALRAKHPIISFTALDCDDALSSDFFTRLNQEDWSTHRMITFSHGITSNLTDTTYSILDARSHFHTSLNTPEHDRTMCGYDVTHVRAIDTGFMREVITDEPMWLEYTHSTNVYNVIDRPHYLKNILKYYNLDYVRTRFGVCI